MNCFIPILISFALLLLIYFFCWNKDKHKDSFVPFCPYCRGYRRFGGTCPYCRGYRRFGKRCPYCPFN